MFKEKEAAMKKLIAFMMMMAAFVASSVTWAVPADGPIGPRPFPEASAGLQQAPDRK